MLKIGTRVIINKRPGYIQGYNGKQGIIKEILRVDRQDWYSIEFGYPHRLNCAESELIIVPTILKII